jgi:hypothetical protein
VVEECLTVADYGFPQLHKSSQRGERRCRRRRRGRTSPLLPLKTITKQPPGPPLLQHHSRNIPLHILHHNPQRIKTQHRSKSIPKTTPLLQRSTIITSIGIQCVALAKMQSMTPYHFFAVWILSLLLTATHIGIILANGLQAWISVGG